MKRIFEVVFQSTDGLHREYWIQRNSARAAGMVAERLHNKDSLRIPNGYISKIKLLGTIDS